MSDWALVRNNVIENVIVVADAADLPDGVDPLDPHDYVAGEDNDYQRAVDLDALEQDDRPGIGWIFKRGAGYVPPEQIHVDRVSIPPDGRTVAVVTYRDNRPGERPHEVDVDVNGTRSKLQLTGGSGSIRVASRTPGDRVTVTVAGAGLTVDVEDPNG